MIKSGIVVFLLALAGCSGVAQRHSADSPCDTEASYACQVQRYHDVAQ